MKNKLHFQKEAVIELNTDSIRSINSGHFTTVVYTATVAITREITRSTITWE